MKRLGSSILLLASALLVNCETYDAPPAPFIEGGEDGVLEDPSAPLIISFAEPVDPETVAVKVIRFDTDVEGKVESSVHRSDIELRIEDSDATWTLDISPCD